MSAQLRSSSGPVKTVQRPVLVAVSGGRDSVVLLHHLLQQGSSPLVVCHFNHRLRGRASGRDAQFVRRMAKQLGLPLELETADVAAFARRHKLSLETAARQLRHEFLARCARRHHTRQVYLGHHANDQAETLLANLCRGCSLRGAGAMRIKSSLRVAGITLQLHRPLLHWSRAKIDAFIAGQKLRFCEDASNADPMARRNRLRHEVLPLLDGIFAREVATQLSRFAAQAARDEDCLEALAADLLRSLIHADGSLDARGLAAADPALGSRALAMWFKQRRVPDIGTVEIEAALAMLAPDAAARLNLPGGLALRRKARRLWIEPPKRLTVAGRRMATGG